MTATVSIGGTLSVLGYFGMSFGTAVNIFLLFGELQIDPNSGHLDRDLVWVLSGGDRIRRGIRRSDGQRTKGAVCQTRWVGWACTCVCVCVYVCECVGFAF